MEDTILLQKIGEMMDAKLEEQSVRFDARFERLENRMNAIEHNLHETRIIVESLPKQIQLIAEQHGDIIQNQKKLDDYDETKSRVSTLEHVVKAHTGEIKELKQAAV